MISMPDEGQALFDGWLRTKQQKVERRRSRDPHVHHGLRFVFYGRMSTSGYQDRRASRFWQLEIAERLVDGQGVIVDSFFDEGCSRTRAWHKRPATARLLTLLADPDRGFDAIVVGEYERAFCGRQFEDLVPVFEESGVQVWLPEAGGRVDFTDDAHSTLMKVLGAQSEREVMRTRNRVIQAMRAQTCDQGRYLGGRPPYGSRLVDGGPHPNRVHAKWGRRLQKLEPDAATAPHVEWIFERRSAGCSIAGIARMLNERAVPSPSGSDLDRNRHRSDSAWSVQTVAAILGNPRYTGRQVWNRVVNDRAKVTPGSGRPGQRPNEADQWAVSVSLAHTPLVGTRTFAAVQEVRAARPTGDGGSRVYLLAGLVVCGICGRRMDSNWVHGRASYRCRHGRTTAQVPAPGAPKILYWREDRLLAAIATALTTDDSGSVRVGDIPDLLRSAGLRVVCDGGDVRNRAALPSQLQGAGPGQGSRINRSRSGGTAPAGVSAGLADRVSRINCAASRDAAQCWIDDSAQSLEVHLLRAFEDACTPSS
ncbi:recombinase family protein [Saccharothrix sp. NRRL B-16348]|uniref:recombinase family protein n=1 Tax=Saccharothrix sp. NRRL B-16348 TaxID=1415542 RepID=UPI000A8DB14A|nr:recombinase family protein [Saccharothrix sp. NRRL B-16348]